MLNHIEIEEILESKEFHINLLLIKISNATDLNTQDVLGLCVELEECADVMHDLPAYHSLTRSIYDLVAFMRAQTPLITQRHGPFLRFLNGFIPTLKQLRVVIFDYDIDNKNGFYASFANDCKMLEQFLLEDFAEENGDCVLF